MLSSLSHTDLLWQLCVIFTQLLDQFVFLCLAGEKLLQLDLQSCHQSVSLLPPAVHGLVLLSQLGHQGVLTKNEGYWFSSPSSKGHKFWKTNYAWLIYLVTMTPLPAGSAAECSALCPRQTSSCPGSSCLLRLWPGWSVTASPPATFCVQLGASLYKAENQNHSYRQLICSWSQGWLRISEQKVKTLDRRYSFLSTVRLWLAWAASCLAAIRSCDGLLTWRCESFPGSCCNNFLFNLSTSEIVKNKGKLS